RCSRSPPAFCTAIRVAIAGKNLQSSVRITGPAGGVKSVDIDDAVKQENTYGTTRLLDGSYQIVPGDVPGAALHSGDGHREDSSSQIRQADRAAHPLSERQ